MMRIYFFFHQLLIFNTTRKHDDEPHAMKIKLKLNSASKTNVKKKFFSAEKIRKCNFLLKRVNHAQFLSFGTELEEISCVTVLFFMDQQVFSSSLIIILSVFFALLACTNHEKKKY